MKRQNANCERIKYINRSADDVILLSQNNESMKSCKHLNIWSTLQCRDLKCTILGRVLRELYLMYLSTWVADLNSKRRHPIGYS